MRMTDTEIVAGYILTFLVIGAGAAIIGACFYALIVLMMAAIP